MQTGLRGRIVLVVAATAAALFLILPSLVSVEPGTGLAKLLPDRKINLGLDLKGGMHLTLGVEVDKAVENAVSSASQSLRSLARERELSVLKPETVGKETLKFTLVKPEHKDKLEELFKEFFRDYTVKSQTVGGEGRLEYVLTLKPEAKKSIADNALDQAVKTIRNRIDQFGVSEPEIRKQAVDHRIQIQLPGLKDPDRAVQILGKTAHLEFKIVDDAADPQKAAKGQVPPGTEYLPLIGRGAETAGESGLVVRKDAVLTGEHLVDARSNFDQSGESYVGITFSPFGGKLFAQVSGENIKKRMAIVLDGKIYSAPVIQDKIVGGRASITGRFSAEEAHDLAIVLRAGALPAPVKILEQRSVGPSLGQESIEKGLTAVIVGGGLILLFMAVYYGLSGLAANAALLLNLLLIMAGLALFGATLTLPGIAGIVLTIGIAVDANVLIFERIREELRHGRTVRDAVDLGFSRATLTIVDANVTTAMTAAILYQFGTGPIRGFAVTLILGIVASMFTAIFVSRLLFDAWLAKPGRTKLSI